MHETLIQTLAKVDRPGDVCVAGDLPLTMPGLDVVPQEPADFRRANKLSCSCSDCSELSRFLADPDQCEKRMKLNKGRRRHLHDIIRSNRCDLTHVTERYGSPYTLVCTKTTASYQRACKINERDLSNLSRIECLENRIV